jgi:hypothetical protein
MKVKTCPIHRLLISTARMCLPVLLLIFILDGRLPAESCLSGGDMDTATRSALETAARHYFDLTVQGDTASLQQSAIPSLAANFSGVASAVKDSQASFAGAQATPRPPFLLQQQAATPLERAEFFCGVFGARGQTADSAVFVIPNLAPGNYGVVILDVASSKGAYTLSFVLEQQATSWKLGGFYLKPAQVAGHDGTWFAERARVFKSKGQKHNAWFYYLEARDLLAPVPFMSTMATDKLYDEAQAIPLSDLPTEGPIELTGTKTYRLTAIFPLVVGNDLDLVVKYQSADVSDTAKAFQENSAVIRALSAKYPEFRDAFAGIVARAVQPDGRDYGSLLPMSEIK